ncbi:MAG: dihydroxyacetone kinase subunit DhaL [Actinomycetes bacterium]
MSPTTAGGAATFDAETARAWAEGVADTVQAQRDHLTALDAAIGDGDHGMNLDRGMAAVRGRLDEAAPETPGAVLAVVGRTLISTVGGASGPLYGTLFRAAAKALGDDDAVTGERLTAALRAGVDGVRRLGKAEPDDKTMLDALLPALDAMDAAVADGMALAQVATRGAEAAAEGQRKTVPMEARKGRASYLGPRSVGHEDPGAASASMVMAALASALGGEVAERHGS